MDEGAFVFIEHGSAGASRAFTEAMADLAYANVEDGPTEVELWGAEGAWGAKGPFCRAVAIGLARRLASSARAARVFFARLTSESPIECELDDLHVPAAADPRGQGAWPDEVRHAYGGNLADACDGKAYFAVSSLLSDACDQALPDGTLLGRLRFAAPATLGSARLDAIALEVRLAGHAVVTSVTGKVALRVAVPGGTALRLVDPAELATLRESLGGRMRG